MYETYIYILKSSNFMQNYLNYLNVIIINLYTYSF